MKIALVVGLILIGVVGLFFVFSSPENKNETQQSISMNEINEDIAAGSELIDVRTPEEFSEGYIDGAINLPLDSIKAGNMPQVSKDSTVYVYCRSGNRSAEAKQKLNLAGYSNVVDLGGINEVVALGGNKVN